MFNIKEIINITKAKIINGKEDIEIKEFSISKNSWKLNSFYIPINFRGDRQKYILKAVENGIMGFMISSSYEDYKNTINQALEINPNILIIEVEDINNAIYALANFIRQKNINMPIIAVTGSVGKTSTCEMISCILKTEKKVYSDNGNNNTKELLSYLMLNIEGYDIAVLEAGVAREGKMEPISQLLLPSICVINNIGTSHIGNFGSRENILKEKILITSNMKDDKIVLLNNDNDMLNNLQLDSKYKVIKYSIDHAKNIKQCDGKIEFETKVYNEDTKFILYGYGIHNVQNAICAIRVAEIYKISKENIIKGIASYNNVDRRFKIKENNKENIIIDDTYNASYDSMKAGLIAANSMSAKRKIAVLGEMLELGEFSKELHTKVGKVFKDVNFDMLLTQGENTKYICEVAKKYIAEDKVKNYENQEDLINDLLKEIKNGDLIYLKASKKMNFDNIVNELMKKTI